jgi:hypothetical protein
VFAAAEMATPRGRAASRMEACVPAPAGVESATAKDQWSVSKSLRASFSKSSARVTRA